MPLRYINLLAILIMLVLLYLLLDQ